MEIFAPGLKYAEKSRIDVICLFEDFEENFSIFEKSLEISKIKLEDFSS